MFQSAFKSYVTKIHPHHQLSLLVGEPAALYIQQQYRCKYKDKPNKKLKNYKYVELRQRTSASEIAREYFDTNYPKALTTKLWPSVRCAMLSRKKYGCVINNFSETDEHQAEMKRQGAFDLIAKLSKSAEERSEKLQEEIVSVQTRLDESDTGVKEGKIVKNFNRIAKLEDEVEDLNALVTSLIGMKVYLYQRKDFTEFVDPFRTVSDEVLPYFLLDAASCLPVFLLNLKPNDSVLDMCASPGGKLTTMLQTMASQGDFVANDVSKQRVNRLKRVVHQYIPKNVNINLKVVNYDARNWSEIETDCYSKVLVDVPCTNDRLSMYQQEQDTDSIFSVRRKKERNQLPKLQAEILRNALLACRPGGTVVYSTCSISPLQNDFIVDYVIHELREELGIQVTSHCLDYFTKVLESDFNFHRSSRGILVYPTIQSNFGPMYMARLTKELPQNSFPFD